jgi:hypothetical protein
VFPAYGLDPERRGHLLGTMLLHRFGLDWLHDSEQRIAVFGGEWSVGLHGVDDEDGGLNSRLLGNVRHLRRVFMRAEPA